MPYDEAEVRRDLDSAIRRARRIATSLSDAEDRGIIEKYIEELERQRMALQG